MEPSYLALHSSGELTRRAKVARDRLSACDLCPRECGLDRTQGELGYCDTGRLARVASFDLHWGEEDPLVGQGGSGTIFFSHCNLGCVFCQNWDISRGPQHGGEQGIEVAPNQLAWMMLELQRRGAENINLVSPSHVAAQILEALILAVADGLTLPLVWNTGGYDSPRTLALLDGVVDIYMPDTKFHDPDIAKRFCNAPDYPERARAAIATMHAQVGDLTLDDNGVATRGLLVRHLVMPDDLAGTAHWMRFLAGLSKNTYVNIMGQYRPCGQAHVFPELARAVTASEVKKAKEIARDAGLTRLDRRKGGIVRFLMQKSPSR
ncbi:radical SAM protein [Desulfovibrio ferrophilus]|uniref:Radical SAM protein n=1 Tax=Desulfovibrio ferrophilus TaxID=241368 RepID=A0A2Z6B1X4_9BACT|nr:radical SAM protein [Desulfovibrio ferrophilus]BBD09517.1 radical SAM protein [Desulfovibrio ferrophilus]